MADGLVTVAERVFGVRLHPRQRELLLGLERTPNAVISRRAPRREDPALFGRGFA